MTTETTTWLDHCGDIHDANFRDRMMGEAIEQAKQRTGGDTPIHEIYRALGPDYSGLSHEAWQELCMQ